jgi:hypothetical protein
MELSRGPIVETLSLLALRYDWIDKIRDVFFERPASDLPESIRGFKRVCAWIGRTGRWVAYVTQKYVFHAPDYARLVYYRHFKHALRLAELAVRRSYGVPRRLLWLLLIGWPRRIRERLARDTRSLL